MKTFDLIVEKSPTNIELELRKLRWDGESPPDIVVMEGGTMLIKVGRYAAPGDQYRYRVARVARMKSGKLTGSFNPDLGGSPPEAA